MPGKGRPKKPAASAAAAVATKKLPIPVTRRSISKKAESDAIISKEKPIPDSPGAAAKEAETTSDVITSRKKTLRDRDARSASKNRRQSDNLTPTPTKRQTPERSSSPSSTPTSRKKVSSSSRKTPVRGRDNLRSLPAIEKTPPTTRRSASVSKQHTRSPSPMPSPSNSQQSSTSSSNGRSSAEALMNTTSITPNMPTSELIRRLKIVSSAFQSMQQQNEEGDYDQLIPFCLHLADEHFLCHSSADVRILIACCLADILRIFAPEAPFKDPNEIKSIFKFLIGQLEGIKNGRGLSFTRHYYLLENLSVVKCFALCFHLDDEDAQEIFIALFGVLFSSINATHNEKTRIVMCDLLSPLLQDSPSISFELLDVILKHFLEPNKSTHKMAYQLAKELILRSSDSLESSIESLLNTILVGNAEDQSLHISHRIFDVLYELNSICPPLLNNVLPQLEHKLKSFEDEDRRGAVTLLAKLFSERNSTVKTNCSPLWQAFLGRFNDISVEIRKICVQHSMHFLLNHPDTRKDIEENLCRRLHDADERVRMEVVKAVMFTASNGGFQYVAGNEHLLDCLKERTMDKKPKIRHLALQGLADIYKMYLDDKESSLEAPPAWIHNRILKGYYLNDVEDRTLIERLFNTCIVPYTLDAKKRMLQLMYVCSTTDDKTCKAFIEIQKHLIIVRRNLADLLKNLRSTFPNKQQALNSRISALSKFVPNSVHGSEFITKLIQDMETTKTLFSGLERIVAPTSDCKTVVENVNKVLKQLGLPAMTNVYYTTIKILLERASSVLIDKEAVLVLLKLVSDLVHSEESSLNDVFRSKEFPTIGIIIEKSCDLIAVLASLHTAHFDNEEVLKPLIKLLVREELATLPSSTILSALVTIGKEQRAIDLHQPAQMEVLKDFCLSLVEGGSPRQAKMAIRCLSVNLTNDATKKEAFTKVLEIITTNLDDPAMSAYATAVVALGHVAILMPKEFRPTIKSLIRVSIIRGLLMNPRRTLHDSTRNQNKNWCDENSLPHGTRCMIYGMKTVARWLVGLETDAESAKKTFKMLTAFVETGGSFLDKDQASPFSNSEKAWLRLAAGCSQLKIVQQKGVGDQYDAAQFCSLAQLMNDDVEEVRIRFAAKLHKGLNKGVPNKCLPLDFLGFYALAGFEPNRKIRATLKQYVEADVKVRRDYINFLMLNHPDKDKAAEQLPFIMPDYMLAFAIAVLANNPNFKSYKDEEELRDVQRCLEFILEPIAMKRDSYSFAFYRKLIQGIKNRRNAADLDNEEANLRMYAVCDVAFEVLIYRERFPLQNANPTPVEPKIPALYFAKHVDESWFNTSSYLCEEFVRTSKRRGLKSPGRTPIPRTPTPRTGGKKSQATPKRSKRARNEEQDADEVVNATIDATPTDPKRTRIESEGLSVSENSEGSANNSERNDSIDSAGPAGVSTRGGGNGGSQKKKVIVFENESENDEDDENESPSSPKPASTSQAAVKTLRSKKRPSTPGPTAASKKKKTAAAVAKPKIMLRSKNKM